MRLTIGMYDSHSTHLLFLNAQAALAACAETDDVLQDRGYSGVGRDEGAELVCIVSDAGAERGFESRVAGSTCGVSYMERLWG
jgi:hypothetical protein